MPSGRSCSRSTPRRSRSPRRAGEDFTAGEAHLLLGARSWVDDGDVDLANQYAERQWREFTDRELEPSGTLVLGRLREPQGVGMPLALSPAYALGGADAVELLIAALTALAFVLAAMLARRVVPEPWASAAVLVAGLSPPALAAATTVSPEPVAAALIAGATVCAVRVRERGRLRHAYARRADARAAAVAGPRARGRRAARGVLPRALDARARAGGSWP